MSQTAEVSAEMKSMLAAGCLDPVVQAGTAEAKIVWRPVAVYPPDLVTAAEGRGWLRKNVLEGYSTTTAGRAAGGLDAFCQYRYIKSADTAVAWLEAIVETAGSEGEELWYPHDCADIIAQFARIGATITPAQAQTFWSEFSEKYRAGWLGPWGDCVAGLDEMIEAIKEGSSEVAHLSRHLRTWSPGQAARDIAKGAASCR